VGNRKNKNIVQSNKKINMSDERDLKHFNKIANSNTQMSADEFRELYVNPRPAAPTAETKKIASALMQPPKKKNKYNAVKTEVDGIVFDSAAESKRYTQLMYFHQAKLISKPILQFKFLLPGEIFYICDFLYMDYENRCFVVEDVKGYKTDVYKLKKKLMKATYNIDIVEIN
jgi:hypothetical protein